MTVRSWPIAPVGRRCRKAAVGSLARNLSGSLLAQKRIHPSGQKRPSKQPSTVRISSSVDYFLTKEYDEFHGIAFFYLGIIFRSRLCRRAKDSTFCCGRQCAKIAEAYALDAVDLEKSQFGTSLDWSEASIENVEKALVKVHAYYIATTPRPTQEQVMSFAKGFGSYVGEVYRRNHGGEWGMVSLNGQKIPKAENEGRYQFLAMGTSVESHY